jgi:hypothetical protein
MEFLDPRGESLTPVAPYRGHAALIPGETIGLFANGFPDSVAFLEHVGAAVQKAVPGICVKMWNKGNASAMASERHLGEIQAECTAVVAAYGH